MTTYTKATNFAVKDALVTGNPLKTLKGTELDDEFNALAVASATKANLASPTFTGVPAAPTATAGTNTTQVATTAFVTDAASTAISTKANIASPTFTGVPAAPTASATTNTTQVATTAFVTAAVAEVSLTPYAVRANNLSDLASATTARTNLGLAIGTDVQAFNSAIMVDGDIGSTVQAYDADTSKTDVSETRSAAINMADNVVQRPVLKDYAETKVAMAANDADLALGNVHTKTISGAATLTFSNPPASGSAGSFTLLLTNGGSAVVTWPTSVDWAVATAPTLTASGVDLLVFTTIDGGTTWYGIASGIGMA